MAYVIGKSSGGSRPWYAVREGQEVHPINAAWFFGGPTRIETSLGTVSCDGGRRFFERKRDVLAAIAAAEGR